MADRALAVLGARYRSYKDDGTVNSGGLIYFYEAGTTTLKDTYSDPEKTTANANPVVLNTRGEAAIYGAGAYKIVEQDSSGTQLGDAMDGVLLLDVSDDVLALLNDGTTAAMRTTLGLGTAATKDAGTSSGNVLLLAGDATLPALDGSALTNIAASESPLPYGYKHGFTLSRSANTTVGITAGACRDSTNAASMRQSTAYTKTFASWAVGTGNGGLDTGSIQASTWYHVFAIYKAVGTTSDFLISASFDPSATLPTGYAYYRYIGSVYTDTNPYITNFSQVGNEVLWTVPPISWDVANLGTTSQSPLLLVPTGVQVWALVQATALHGSSAVSVWLRSPDVTEATPTSATTTPLGTINVAAINERYAGGIMKIRTDTSATIRANSSVAGTSLDIVTLGWIENFN